MRAKPESTINSWKSRASNLIVLVESEIKHKIYHKNIEKGEQEAISLQKNAPRKSLFYYSLSIEESIASRVANLITSFAIVY